MITNLLLLLVFNALYIMGLYSITRKGMIFGFMQSAFLKPTEDEYEEDYKLPWLYKPLIGCPTCMASVHSTYVYLLYIVWIGSGWDWQYLIVYPFYAIALAGLNALLHKYLEAI